MNNYIKSYILNVFLKKFIFDNCKLKMFDLLFQMKEQNITIHLY